MKASLLNAIHPTIKIVGFVVQFPQVPKLLVVSGIEVVKVLAEIGAFHILVRPVEGRHAI